MAAAPPEVWLHLVGWAWWEPVGTGDSRGERGDEADGDGDPMASENAAVLRTLSVNSAGLW